MKTIAELRTALEVAAAEVIAAGAAFEALPADATDEAVTAAEGVLTAAIEKGERCKAELEAGERRENMRRAAEQFKPLVGDPSAERTGDPAGTLIVKPEHTYYPGSKRSFIVDALDLHGSTEVRERIEKHNAAERERRIERAREAQVEYRDVATGAFGALIPEVYLNDLYAAPARAGRAFANAVRRLPLPEDGMVFKIPRLTTGTAAAVQASENAAVQETDADETTLTIDVRTIAGMQDISRQAIDRGSNLDRLLIGDLAAAYAMVLNTQALSGSGSSGQLPGILNQSGVNAVTYTDASPTIGELWPKLMDAIARVGTNRLLPASGIIMHPRRWAWMLAQLDSSGRPFMGFAGQGATNVLGVGSAAVEAGQVVGNIAGVPVILDPLLPINLGAGTNEDAIIVARLDDIILWDEGDTPRELRFDQPLANTLTVRLVVYGYAAFSGGRYPAATSIITGTGLVAPTF